MSLRPKRPLAASLLVAAALFGTPVAAPGDADPRLGKQVFLETAEPRCGICHTLAAAGTSGDVGPNLDELELTEDKVRAAVTNGVEAMPAYGDSLTLEQIDAVARYVAEVAGQAE